MPEILLLPEKTRTRLRSTQIITSLPQLISELLQNALDAGAKHVDTSIDCEEWTCTVRDDGVGIPREGLKILSRGGEEGRYGQAQLLVDMLYKPLRCYVGGRHFESLQ